MTENRLIAIRRVASGVLAAAVLLLGASTLSAQGTAGKVQGTVLDPTGQPVASAQVFVLGTSFAALTNEEGFYFINNVPAGIYSLRAQFIGYQPAEISNVRILADQTRTVNFRLSGAVALEAITITAAENPIVPRDQVASKAIVTGEEVDQLPVTDALTVVQLQPGVISGRGGSIRIRGSRSNEAVIFVDGTPVRRFDTGSTILNLATNTLQEVSVTTGAMDAAFGDAQAGVISMVTRAGGPRFVGTFAYESDEPFGKNTSRGWNRFEGALSGPLFGNLTFSVGGTVTGNRTAVTGKRMTEIPVYTFMGTDTLMTVAEGATDSALVAIPHIIQFGGECDASQNLDAAGNPVECQGRRRPYGWSTNVRANAKLQLTYGRGSRISLSGLTDIAQNMNAQTMNFENSNGGRTVSNLLVLDWVQQVFRGAESELAFDLNVSYQTDRSLNGAVERQLGLDKRDPFLGIVLSPLDFITDFDRFAPGLASDIAGGGHLITQLKTDDDWDRLIENSRYDRGTLRSYLLRSEVNTRSIPRMNAYGVTGGFSNEGVNRGQGFRVERRYVGRANIDWQADRYNRFKFGAEGQIGRLGRWEMGWVNKSFGNGYVGEPYKYGLYAQDRLDLGDVVIELGVRWDKFNTRTIFPLVPGRIYTNPAFDQDATVETMTCPEVEREDCDINQYVWINSRAHTSLAPRVRVSFPVTDRTGFRLSYAHQTQTPDMFNMYNGTNNDLAATNPNDQFGGDVDFGKTILFEFGIRHAFSPDMVLDVAAYNKDKVSDITYRILGFTDTFTGGISNLNVLTNADFGNVRGVDVQLIRRFGNVFSGQVSYTYQNAQSTGSDPTDYLNGLARQSGGVSGDRPEAPQFTLRTRDDRRHNIQGTFALSFPQDFAPGSGIGAVLRSLGVFGTFQFRSGLPYTLLKNNADGQRTTGGFGLGALAAEPLQSSETGWEKLFDLRVTKGFRFGPTDWTVYADIRNLLNFTNKPVLFMETGDVVNERYLEE
ncbi:MAG: TonB-dependent receptor, partial [Gemmatimonadales bacterium]|nr:TonB-dependent receptor [Gemmatimonadales bacterium]NIN12839.1 TonB-dependent receptor [Gemmatimonadales bacterium]NIN51017.1 TonB-dependent receptor [Gemmatimonadales bacterium]NIP08481.1 TonB-dependent receptor [Gemmatimonadales bacterium]NIR02521.1 TonB-dependent receptor [Gemmatimonadales bacterium]